MKSVQDFINLQEEGEAATNVVGDGTGAIKLTPTSNAPVAKRKPLVDAQSPELDGETLEKKMFKAKQQYQNDQVMSYD